MEYGFTFLSLAVLFVRCVRRGDHNFSHFDLCSRLVKTRFADGLESLCHNLSDIRYLFLTQNPENPTSSFLLLWFKECDAKLTRVFFVWWSPGYKWTQNKVKFEQENIALCWTLFCKTSQIFLVFIISSDKYSSPAINIKHRNIISISIYID